MKKIILIFLILLITGCTKTDASFEVESYLNKFKNHDAVVMNSLEEIVEQQSLTEEQKDMYKLIMKKQYTDLEYQIKNQYFNGDEATITVEITVYDYTESKKRALNEDENITSEEQIIEKELNEMKKEEKRVKYTIEFELEYDAENWHLKAPSKTDLEKIHGIYDYKND